MTYKPEFQSRTTSFDVRVERSLSYLQVKDDLYVYKLTYTHKLPESTPGSIASTYKDKEYQGFAKLLALQDFSDNKVEDLVKEVGLYLVKAEFLEMAQKEGYVTAAEHYAPISKMYDEFAQSEVSPDLVVRIDRGSYTLFDLSGDVLPTAMHFDYTRGQMDEATYDLGVAVEVLRRDPRITPIDPDNYRGQVCTKALQYYDIPYYNSELGRAKTLPFLFSPTKEDMLKLWEKAETYKGHHPSNELHRAVFDLDMLGLRAAGAVKVTSIYC